MKLMLFAALFLNFLPVTYAQKIARQDLAIIKNIDDVDTPRNYVEVSEVALPFDHYLKLLQQMNLFGLTILSESKVRDVFQRLTKDPSARMRVAGGNCSYRRSYIQNYLKKMNAISGKLFIQCPGNIGHMRLRDQVTGHNYTFSNFHDTNIVAVQANGGADFRVLDLQFEDSPISLQEYLSEIEASQKIKPSKRKEPGNQGYCYWYLSTSRLTY